MKFFTHLMLFCSVATLPVLSGVEGCATLYGRGKLARYKGLLFWMFSEDFGVISKTHNRIQSADLSVDLFCSVATRPVLSEVEGCTAPCCFISQKDAMASSTALRIGV